MLRMFTKFFARSIFVCVLAAACAGCTILHDFHPTNVTVTDAETGRPIAGADIAVHYLGFILPCIPSSNSTTSSTLGMASFETASNISQHWKVTADGYMPVTQYTWPGNESMQNLNFSLYHLPRPQVTLVVPDGYRGWIGIKIKSDDSAIQDGKPGGRSFVYHLPSSGQMEIVFSRLLYGNVEGNRTLEGGLKYDLAAQFENGTPIPIEWSSTALSPEIVGLRHFIINSTMQGFLGTFSEQQQLSCPCDE